jgi:hypothetical protein
MVGAIRQSQAFMMLLTEHSYSNMTVATQVGLAVMMDKPFILLAKVGVAIPHALVKMADLIERVDMEKENDMARAQASVAEYMKKRFGGQS